MSDERYTFIRELSPILDELEELVKRLKPVRKSLERSHERPYPGFALAVDLAEDVVLMRGEDLDKATATLRRVLDAALADEGMQSDEESSLTADDVVRAIYEATGEKCTAARADDDPFA